MPGSDAEYIRLGTELDPNSVNQIKQFVSDVEQRFASLDRLVTSVGRSSTKAGQELVDGMRKSRQEIESAGRAADDLGDKIQKASKVDIGLSGLRRTGSALNQLGLGEVGRPVQLAGDIGQVGKEIGEVTTSITAMGVSAGTLLAVAAPVAIAVGAIALAFEAVKKQADDAVEAEKRQFDIEKQRLDLQNANIQKGRSETVEQNVQNQRDLATAISNTSDLIEKKLRQIADVQRQYNDLGQSFNPAKRNELGAVGQQLQKELDELKTQRAKLTEQYRNEGVALAPLVDKHQQAREAIKALDDEMQRELKTAQLQRSGASTKQIQELVDAAQQEAASIRDRIPALEAEAKTSEEGEAALKKYQERLASLNKDLVEFQKLLDQAKAKDAIRNFVKNIEDGIKSVGKAVEPVLKDVQRQIQDGLDRDKRVAAVQQKYNDAVKQAEERGAQERASIYKRYNDQLIQIAERAADAARAALTRLEQQREDLATGLRRDLDKEQRDARIKTLDIQIAAQRTVEKETRDHFDRLDQIRRDAQNREYDLILANDFIGLAQSRRQTNRDIQGANRDFSIQQREQGISNQNQLDDLRRSLAQQRQERLIAYDQALQDAQKQYQRELQRADQSRRLELQRAAEARNRDLHDLNAKLRSEAAIRRSAYVQELQMAATYGKERLKLEQQIQQALVAQANKTLSSISRPTSATRIVSMGPAAHRALGGDVQPGDAYLVNDRYRGQRESVGGMQFMGDMGVYLPFKQGYVNPGSGGSSRPNVSIPITIQGNNPELIGRVVEQKVGSLLERFYSS